MAHVVSEEEFAKVLRSKLKGLQPKAVTGPGRSGAIASAYASHILGVPFLPFGTFCTHPLRPLLVVDTARKSGRTIRQALATYHYAEPSAIWCFDEPPRVIFWYEAGAGNLVDALGRLYRTKDAVNAVYLAGYHQVDPGT
jgi:hypothetical protein